MSFSTLRAFARAAGAAARRAAPAAAPAAARRAASAASSGAAVALGAAVAFGGAAQPASCAWWGASSPDYAAVYKDIAALLDAENYDDGSFGPVLVRLAWHAAGTYSKADGSGGSNGATMRHAAEASHGANAGLAKARTLLEAVKAKHPGISYADLWSLAGVCAIQEMGGPSIPWRAGRSDAPAEKCTPDGRLPDASKGNDHLRSVFGRMGFNDDEIVALSGAHSLGRCHTDRSGFEGPWTFSPTTFSNQYFALLLSEKWTERKWTGPKQFQDEKTKTLMMLPTDMALLADPIFKKKVEAYAKDAELFRKDFASVFVKLLELGVKFPEGAKVMTFKNA
jgi:cytochrome c peroxidase